MSTAVTAIKDSTGVPVHIDAVDLGSGRWALAVSDEATAGLLARAASTAITTVNVQLTSTALLAANTARKGATVQNTDDVDPVYVTLGSTSSLTAHTVKLVPGAYYELPYGYTGAVSAIASVITPVSITELT